MTYLEDFPTDAAFEAFRIWALNGSTIGQRMGVGEEREIPFDWEFWRPLAQKMGAEFPQTREDFYALVENNDSNPGTEGSSSTD